MTILEYKGKNTSPADITVNLLNPPTAEELGKAILKQLMDLKSIRPYLEINGEQLTTRQVVVHGS